MLSLQANANEDENLKLHLREASARVATVARAHERLYQTTDIEKLDVGDYIKDVCGDLPVTDETTVTVEAPVGIQLSMDRAISIALIVVELATNAIKHAYGDERSSVWVALAKKGDALVLSVTDEGRGVPADFAPQKSKGLGMRIVSALATQLNAELTVKRHNKGTSFELRVPLNQPS
jgi:two-component sensor histidine kinase